MSTPASESLPADLQQVRDCEQIRVLQDAVRVFLGRPGPRLLAANAAGGWCLRLALGPLGPLDFATMAAVGMGWPVQEWFMHKYLLHLPPRTDGRDPGFARVHRAHHVNPRDVDQTLLPLYIIRRGIPLNVAGWLLVLGPTRKALTAAATYSTMALLYEWTHFLVHTGYRPRTEFFKRVRKNHRLHHYRNENNWYGFTLPWVDAVLGTEPDPASVPFSPTARDLFGLEAAREDRGPEPGSESGGGVSGEHDDAR